MVGVASVASAMTTPWVAMLLQCFGVWVVRLFPGARSGSRSWIGLLAMEAEAVPATRENPRAVTR